MATDWTPDRWARVMAGVEEQDELTHVDLPAAMSGLRRRLGSGTDMTVEALALAREAAVRASLGPVRPAHLTAAAVLCDGCVADVKDAADRSMAAALAACVYAVRHSDVHVVTGLQPADRDFERFTLMYDRLGLRAALLADRSTPEERKEAYGADVLYSPAYELCYDYVRDHLAWQVDEYVQRGRQVAILDGIDGILIQHGRSPAVVSRTESRPDQYRDSRERVPYLRPGEHFHVSGRQARLTPRGLDHLGLDHGVHPLTLIRRRRVEEALAAAHCYHVNRDYTVRKGAVVGDVPAEIRHALEAKEGLEITDETQTLGEILPWDYYRTYDTLVGLSPTAGPHASMLDALAGATVVMITHDDDVLPAPDGPTARSARQWIADLLEFTEVRRIQRDTIYARRRAALHGEDGDWVPGTLDSVVDRYVAMFHPDAHGLHRHLHDLYPTRLTEDDLTGEREQVIERVRTDAQAALRRRRHDLGEDLAAEVARRVWISVTDRAWQEHLIALEYLSVGFVPEPSQDPRAHYKDLAARLFYDTVERIREDSMGFLFNLDVT
ncbi:hypothetical protein OHA25_26480 [Nonomuraea sp. NBC_00507]|uniref:hypothetical protein n=1 Tax=Nonomuraea sp. NBC_00507 TaxID=2976002 RepID=UPI002E175769